MRRRREFSEVNCRRARAFLRAKDRGSRYQNIRSRRRRLWAGDHVDAAVHFQLALRIIPANHAAKHVNSIDALRDEGLSAEPREHSHAQRQIDEREKRFDSFNRQIRVEREPDFLSGSANLLNQGARVGLDFEMKYESVGARFQKAVEKLSWVFDHQMHFERKSSDRSQALDNCRPHAEIRDEVTIHHIDVNSIGPTMSCFKNEFSESGEIRSQNRRCDRDHKSQAGVKRIREKKGVGIILLSPEFTSPFFLPSQRERPNEAGTALRAEFVSALGKEPSLNVIRSPVTAVSTLPQ